MLFSDSETGCCPLFDPASWDRKIVHWENRLFLHDHVRSFLHLPLNFGQTIVQDIVRIAHADALPKQPIMLSDEHSPWGSEVYIEVTKPIPQARIVRLAGDYLTMVFEGSFRNIDTWFGEMDRFVTSTRHTTKRLYYYYTMCPSCAKFYGKNYLVLVAQVK